MYDLVAYHSINLKKKGVTISFKNWLGELPPYDTLTEVWVDIVGLPPVWCSWVVIVQVASTLGVITNANWHGIFRSLYEVVRVQVAVRDPALIPEDRLFEIQQELFLLTFKVENDAPAPSDNPSDPSNPKDDDDESTKKQEEVDDDSNDDLLGEEMDHDVETNRKNANSMSRPSSAPSGSRTRAPFQSLVISKSHVEETIPQEKSAYSKIQGAPLTKSYLQVVKRTPMENFGNLLLA